MSSYFPSNVHRQLFDRAVQLLENQYDDAMKLVGSGEFKETANEKHSTRDSIHYALGLLLRRAEGDVERACSIIDTILKLQFTDEEEIYYGTFKTSPQSIDPPAGQYYWKQYGDGVTYLLHHTFEQFQEQWFKQEQWQQASHEQRQQLRVQMTSVFEQVIPPVWKSYDPNWREFIGSACSLVLELAEDVLPKELIERIDQAMQHTVQASIDRRIHDAIPMNTNVELMHLWITHYFAVRYNNEAWLKHVAVYTQAFLDDMNIHQTFAEFNSATYYGVDLTVLGMMRRFSKTDEMVQFAEAVELKLWENIALFYNPTMRNLAGPYSRAYEMDLPAHSSLGVFLYLAFGATYKDLAVDNCESAHNILIALLDVVIPEHLVELFVKEQEPREVSATYRELCERHKPGHTRYDCKATAWIEPKLMLGGLAGSQNTSGQLHPATIHWQASDKQCYYMRLKRREPNGHWSTHYRNIYFNAYVNKRTLHIEVELNCDHNMELYFEIAGGPLQAAQYKHNQWTLPGLTLKIDHDKAPDQVIQTEAAIEQIYHYSFKDGKRLYRFTVEAIPHS